MPLKWASPALISSTFRGLHPNIYSFHQPTQPTPCSPYRQSLRHNFYKRQMQIQCPIKPGTSKTMSATASVAVSVQKVCGVKRTYYLIKTSGKAPFALHQIIKRDIGPFQKVCQYFALGAPSLKMVR